MLPVTQLLKKVCKDKPFLLQAICDELTENLSFRAYDATYINEEGVFNLVRELKQISPHNQALSTEETKTVLQSGDNDSALIQKLFSEPASFEHNSKVNIKK